MSSCLLGTQSNPRHLNPKLFRWDLPPLSIQEPKKDSESFKAKVLGIRDGNTLHILYQKKAYTVTLAYIDAPERSQYFGSESQQRLSNRLFLKTITVKPVPGALKEGVQILATDLNGPINKWMVEKGLAWCKAESQAFCANHQKVAQTHKIGLWQQSKAIAPWDYRKKIKSNLAKNEIKAVDFRKDPRYLSLLGQSQESTQYKESELQKKEPPYTPKLPKVPKKKR